MLKMSRQTTAYIRRRPVQNVQVSGRALHKASPWPLLLPTVVDRMERMIYIMRSIVSTGANIMTLELDCEKYVEAVTGPANAWGACLVDGIPSHTFLGIMFDKYGQDMVDAYLKDNYWSKS